MKKSINWSDGHITITPPTKTKKITGTRFGAVLGVNKWSTPFTTWCEITKTWEKPFESTIFTEAGKKIEPLQADFMKNVYGMSNLVTPTDIYGEDYFKTTHGDFFPTEKIFGGMWDYLLVDDVGHPTAVLEMKTSKRVEDWVDDVPEYYALQASLYAYLLGVDDVYMVASFLEMEDYSLPELFTPSFENTKVIKFKVSERYPNFQELIDKATYFWDVNVKLGVSPDYDEKKDKEVLDALREMCPDSDLDSLCAEAETLEGELKLLKDRYKLLTDTIKEKMKKELTSENNKCIINTVNGTWTLSRGTTTKLDTERLKEEGLYDDYVKTSVTETLRYKEKKENGN